MSHSPRDYLRHILDETSYLKNHAEGLHKNQFVHDETVSRTFIRSLEIIGEASKKIRPEFRNRYPQVDWRAMGGRSV